MATTSRATTVKTPGVATPQDAQQLDAQEFAAAEVQDSGADQAGDQPEAAQALPVDLQAMIDAAVERRVAAQMAQLNPGRPSAAPAVAKLPTEAEALKQVIASDGRAILSDAGYVCLPPASAKVTRDANGFAKD